MKSALALCVSALAAASCLTIRAPLRAPLHAPRRATPLMNELQKEVEQRRLFRTVGVGAGVALLSGGLGVGVVAGVLDGNVVGGAFSTVGVVGSALFGAYTFSFEESREPYSPVAPAESAPGMGSGLFATADIPKDTYLFDYEGERLTEPEMFERYPDGQGRITWPCRNSHPDRLRPSRPPARPWASAGSSAGRPSASASLGQFAGMFWLAGHTGLVLDAGTWLASACLITSTASTKSARALRGGSTTRGAAPTATGRSSASAPAAPRCTFTR
mgnify:FL=1